MPTITITDAALQKSATQFQKELLLMPIIGASETLQHMTARPGLHGPVVLSQMLGDAELGPYDPARIDEGKVEIVPRTLEVFLGSLIKRFDPNELRDTVWGSLVTQGVEMKNVDIAKEMLTFLSTRLGASIAKSLWTAKRNPAGTKTADLFDGFDTITDKEIAAGNIAVGKGNEHDFSAAITAANAVDFLKSFYFSASDELQTQKVKMFMPVDVYNAYCEGYKAETGATAYNTTYDKTYLEGSHNLCELVPLANKKGSKYIHLAPQSTFVYGYGDGMADEKIEIMQCHELLLSYVATMFFGCQFRSLQPELFHVGKLHGVV